MEEVKVVGNLYDEFYNDYPYKNVYQDKIVHSVTSKFIADMPLKNISWKSLFEIKLKGKKSNITRERQWYYFLLWLIQNNYYLGSDADDIVSNKKDILEYFRYSGSKKFMAFDKTTSTPYSYIKLNFNYSGAKKDSVQIVYIPYANKALKELLCEYFDYVGKIRNGKKTGRFAKAFIAMFDDASAAVSFSNVNNYNDKTFEKHIKLVSHFNDIGIQTVSEDEIRHYEGEIISFYRWIQEEKLSPEEVNDRFKIYNSTAIAYPYFLSSFLEGIPFIRYSIYDPTPYFEKMVLVPHYDNRIPATLSEKCTVIDVSDLKNHQLKKWYLDCFWKDVKHNFSKRLKTYSPLKGFLKVIDARVDEMDTDIKVEMMDILEYKANVLSKHNVAGTEGRNFAIIKYFFKYLENDTNVIIDPIFERLLVHHDNENNAKKESFTNNEVKSLEEAYRKNFEECKNEYLKMQYTLYYFMMMIQSHSSIRPSSIIRIRDDSLHLVLNSETQREEYEVVVPSKRSGTEDEVYPINRYVKGLIEEVTALTSGLRESAKGEMKRLIFIYRKKAYGAIGQINQDSYVTYHHAMCQEAGITDLPPNALRNYYMNQVSSATDNKELIEKATGHSYEVHIRNYEDVDIREFAQRYYNEEIGDVNLNGSVESNQNIPKDRIVADGCGGCQKDHCIMQGLIDCMLCRQFVTTPAFIPRFEQKIEEIDQRIYNQSIAHEKEFLNLQKKIMVAYVARLMEVKKNGSRQK